MQRTAATQGIERQRAAEHAGDSQFEGNRLRIRVTRVAGAVLGTVLVVTALVMIWVLRLSIPRELYVSELGASSEPTADAFKISLLLLVAGASLIGYAGRGIRSRVQLLNLWTPAVSLWIASSFFLLAAQVNCTATCPLPWGETFTWQDLFHIIFAVFAAAASWAMVQVSFAEGHRRLAGFSLSMGVAVAFTAAVGGLLSVFQFATDVGSRLELVATTLGIAWVASFGVAVAAGALRSLSGARSSPLYELEEAIGHADEDMDLVLVALDPAVAGFGRDRHEVEVLLPDHEGAFGTQHVLLPPHLPKVRTGNGSPVR